MSLRAAIETDSPTASQSGPGTRDATKCRHHQPLAQGDRVVATSAGAALLAASLLTRSWPRVLLATAGATLAYRGVTGDRRIDTMLGIGRKRKQHPRVGVRAGRGFRYRTALTIQSSLEDVYRRWRDLERLPEIFEHLTSVAKTAAGKSHWVAEGPFGKSVEWDAEVINEVENELIAWQSLPGSDIDTAGSVHFERAPVGRGMILRVALKYDPPAGKLGATIASLFGANLEKQVDEDLKRFKQLVETGEIATVAGQTHGSC